MNREFVRATGYRALRTFCQTAVALLPAAAMIHEVDWITVAGTSALAAAASILTSIATGLPEVQS